MPSAITPLKELAPFYVSTVDEEVLNLGSEILV